MATVSLANGKMTKPMASASLQTSKVTSMKVSGLMIANMAMVLKLGPSTILNTKATSSNQRSTAKVDMSGLMEVTMKVNSKMVFSMAQELITLLISKRLIQEILKMRTWQVMEEKSTRMVESTLENLNLAKSTEQEP
jgi:hypothetical protein